MLKKACKIFAVLVLIQFFQHPIAAQDVKNRIIHVSKSGSDSNDGSAKSPLLTIQKAVSIAQAGNKIILHKGVYRESVDLPFGGVSENSRIEFVAAPGEKVNIKGSERIANWKRLKIGIWSAVLDETFFHGFNPFAKFINQDSSFLHLGNIYLDNKPFVEKSNLEQINKMPETWFCEQLDGKTIITANFGNANPNLKIAEASIRQNAFFAKKNGVNYITIKGIEISQIASSMAAMDGEQSGAIATNGGTRWVIQDCSISNCSSVGICIGQTGHTYPTATPTNPEYRDLSQDTSNVGHHVIIHNHIFRCGQAGIFGLLHGSFSEVKNNLIEDINNNKNYPSKEVAGIRLAYSIDVQINHNLIRHVNGPQSGYGLFIGPLFQGMRISKNIIEETFSSSIYLYDCHGPALIDNNVILGNSKLKDQGIKTIGSEANVFIQNLFQDCSFINERMPGKTKATSNFLPHSLVIKQTIPALAMDDRWFGNLFIRQGLNKLGATPDCKADHNCFTSGALASTWEGKNSLVSDGTLSTKIINSALGITLSFTGAESPNMPAPIFTPALIGFFALSKQYCESPNGVPITIDKDFFGKEKGNRKTQLAGPFYELSSSQDKGISLFNF